MSRYFPFIFTGLVGLAFFVAGCKQSEPPPPAYLLTGNQFAECIEVLKEALTGEDDAHALEAARVLSENGYGFEIVTPFQYWLDQEEDPIMQVRIATELLRAGDEESYFVLEDALLAGDTAMVELGIRGLYEAARFINEEQIILVRDSLGSPAARFFARAILAEGQGDRVLSLARQAILSDSNTRHVVLPVLAGLGDAKDIGTLIPLRNQVVDDHVRLEYTGALAMLGHPGARNDIVQLLDVSDGHRRARAAHFAGHAWIIEESARLYALLEDPDRMVQISAAEALLLLGDSQSLARQRWVARN